MGSTPARRTSAADSDMPLFFERVFGKSGAAVVTILANPTVSPLPLNRIALRRPIRARSAGSKQSTRQGSHRQVARRLGGVPAPTTNVPTPDNSAWTRATLDAAGDTRVGQA
jgi:hypothetical protein